MSGHAPGPWKVVISEQHIVGEPLVSVIDAEGNTVCDNETYYPQALDPKNASLIAASTEMLEALEIVQNATIDIDSSGSWGSIRVTVEDWNIIKSAIARAIGESS